MPLYSATCPLPKNQILRRHQTEVSPIPTTGLSLWLKADTGVTLSGADVTGWADQSGNGKNASAIGTPSLSTISGKTFMNFAGGFFVGDALLTQPLEEAQATIMCVARFTNPTDIGMMFQQYGENEYDNLAFYRGFNSGESFEFRIFNGADLTSDSAVANNQTYLFGTIVDTTVGVLYLNGIEEGLDAVGDQATEGEYLLGRWGSGGQTTTELRMAEIVVYDRFLTTPERIQVEEYLNTKYEIY